MDKNTFEKLLKISEEFFGTQNDPRQMSISQDSTDKLYSIHKDTIVFKFDENRNPIAWAVIVPTSTNTMTRFLKNEITEKELLDIAVEEKKFDALYLCGVFVLPQYRMKGYAKDLLVEAVNKIPNGDRATLYAWIYSKEGEKLCASLSKEIGRPILSIKD